MARFIIDGERPLQGKVEIAGMKNAATPILAATLLTPETCTLNNIPEIDDVARMLEILEDLGARIERSSRHTLKITCQNINPEAINQTMVSKMRSSVLLLGPLLARSGQVSLAQPGGCIIGVRPIDVHLSALKKLGAEVEIESGTYRLKTRGLKSATVILPEFSVTATENVVMAAVLTPGTTIIKLAAAEPHVQDLCNFLNKLGANIQGIGTHTLVIEGVGNLSGAEHTLIPDQIEIGTFAIAAAVTRGEVNIAPIIPEHLEAILMKLDEADVRYRLKDDSLTVLPSPRLRAFKLKSLPYPGFPTDLQAPFAVLATQARGTSLIHDPLYEGRLGYVSELIKMGANATVCDPHRVLITGPVPLYGQEIKSFDLRAGATLIIAGLVAKGRTVIENAETVDRGYELIDVRLRRLGAHIERVTE